MKRYGAWRNFISPSKETVLFHLVDFYLITHHHIREYIFFSTLYLYYKVEVSREMSLYIQNYTSFTNFCVGKVQII